MESLRVMTVDKPHIIELLKTVHSFSDAMKLAMRQGKKEHKQVYLEMGIDKGQWSRIMSGQATLSHDLLGIFCEIVDNDIIIHWLAYQRGYELRVIPKVLEEQLSETQEENKALKNQVEMLKEALRTLGEGIERKEIKKQENNQKSKEK